MRRLFGIVFFFLFLFLIFSVQEVQAQQRQLNLSAAAKNAIKVLAKDMVLNGPNPRIMALKPQLDNYDYVTVKNIGILPDSPLYILKSLGRNIRLFFIFDQPGEIRQLLKDGNEKTLESLLVIEKAANEKNTRRRERLIQISINALDSVGSDFEIVSKTLDVLKKNDFVAAYTAREEAFQFAGYYLKHQILLQKQEDRLNEQDFLAVERVRIKHLRSIAHIIVSENSDPGIFGERLSQLLSSQVGSNNTQLATIAVLRDLENNANKEEIKPLQNGQAILQDKLAIKLAKLPKQERLKQVERYIAFVHGNPIREFQAYNFLSKGFNSTEMETLTRTLKDKAAHNFKKHLVLLATTDIQKKFVQTLFSNYPIDTRLLMYAEIQLKNDKNMKESQKSEQAALQLERLQQIKAILSTQVCQSYGKDPKSFVQTRFYTEATATPSLLDIRIGEFLNQSLRDCNGKTPEVIAAISDLQTKMKNKFITEAKKEVFITLPPKAKAEQILKEENIVVTVQDEQKVAEKIEEEISHNSITLEQEAQQIVENIVQPKETVIEQTNEPEVISNDTQTIIEEILQESEPTAEEIAAKEDQILEEIVDAAEIGETSPLVEDLPTEVQEEIIQETETVTPASTLEPTATPVVTGEPTTVIEETTPTPIPSAVPEL